MQPAVLCIKSFLSKIDILNLPFENLQLPVNLHDRFLVKMTHRYYLNRVFQASYFALLQ